MAEVDREKVFVSETAQAAGWDEIFDALDRAGFPDDFLADRTQGLTQERKGCGPHRPAAEEPLRAALRFARLP